MATFTTFEEIGAWQKARQLTKELYKVTSSGSFARDYDLRNQIRRAAVSIMSNIDEGFERRYWRVQSIPVNGKRIGENQVAALCGSRPGLFAKKPVSIALRLRRSR